MEGLEERLQAMEAALTAATTRAEAAERAAAQAQAAAAGAAGVDVRTPVVDTRLLSRPESFDGTEAAWRGFRFKLLAYCEAVNPRLGQLARGALQS